MLTDDDLRKPGVIGPIELRFRGRWPRVEDALAGLPHDAVRYRWRDDSTGEPALFIEVPLAKEVSAESLLERRDSVHNAVAGATDRAVYVHFVGAEDVDDEADA